jgi:hypothetical protein
LTAASFGALLLSEAERDERVAGDDGDVLLAID